MIYWPNKTPDEAINFGMNWAPTLSLLGDATIVASSWTRISGSALLGSDSIDTDGRGTVVRISGGDDATDYIMENTVTLSDGEILTEKAYGKVRA